MKDKANKQKLVPRGVINLYHKIAFDDGFSDFIEKQREELTQAISKAKGVMEIAKAHAACKRAINSYLQDRNLPSSWVSPLFVFVKDDILDFPIDNGITLKVADQEITENTEGILIIQTVGQHDAGKLTIELTAKVSTDRIIDFIKEHRKEIEYYEEILDLPRYENPKWTRSTLAALIIRLKDQHKFTFQRIAVELSKDPSLSKEEHDYRSDENNIKTLYSRYKKHFQATQ